MILISKIQKKLSNQFIRNIGWLGGGEFVSRLFRICLVVVIARVLTPHDYALAAIILTVKELALVFTFSGGIGGKLVQAKEQDVEVLSTTAYWLNWILCGLLFVLQCILSVPISWFYGEPQLVFPICAIALSYLSIPVAAVQISLLDRENKLKIVALISTLQVILSNILTLCFALLGMGFWAIILPSVFVGPPVLIYLAYRNHPWRPKESFTLHRWREIAGFSQNVLGSQFLDKLRANLDYLLVGKLLGVEALGLYFFAFNSGLGISLSVIEKLSWAQFPYICAAQSDFNEFRKRYFSTLKTMSLIVIPLVLLQSSLAPLYIPIIFGKQWIETIPVVVLICLSAIPRLYGYAASRLLYAIDRTDIDLKWNLLFTLVFAIALLFSIQWGLVAVAAAVLISHVVGLSIFVVWINKFVFGSKQFRASL